MTFTELCLALEKAVQQDEGGRGIRELIGPHLNDHLQRAARDLSAASSVCVLTGFPCNMRHEVPTETDGIAGALALAKSVLARGGGVRILTDRCNEGGVRAACEAHPSLAGHLNEGRDRRLEVLSFPPAASFGDAEEATLREAYSRADHIVAIERSGSASDGHYYTMRALDMSHLVAPLDRMLLWAAADRQAGRRAPTTAGIGDGGNEVGMGVVADRVAAYITNGPTIACQVPADNLVVASVSNWGGYALALAAAALHASRQQQDHEAALRAGVPDEADERAIAAALVKAGVRDGKTGELAETVDGFSLERNLQVLQGLTADTEAWLRGATGKS